MKATQTWLNLDPGYDYNDNLAPEYKSLLKENKISRYIHIDSETHRFQGLFVTVYTQTNSIGPSLTVPLDVLDKASSYKAEAITYLGRPHILWTIWFKKSG